MLAKLYHCISAIWKSTIGFRHMVSKHNRS